MQVTLRTAVTYFLGFLWIAFIFSACRSTEPAQQIEPGYYHKTQPLAQVEQMESLLENVHRLIISGHYSHYYFDEEDEVTMEDIRRDSTILEEANSSFEIESTGGTATILRFAEGRPLVLTAHHVINKPDTVRHYYEDELGNRRGLAQLNIRRNIDRIMPRERHLGQLEVLVEEPGADVALLTTEESYDLDEDDELSGFHFGDATRLEWGSQIFTIAFPRGNKMFSTAMVSQPNNGEYGSFMTDVLFNPGSSGGAILAFNREEARLELVGMARSASASSDFMVRPAGEIPDYRDGALYEGPLYLERDRRINYGIVYSIPVNLIRAIMERHEDTLESAGFSDL